MRLGFSSPEYKMQFEVWLGTVYPPKGQAEDRAKAKGEQASMHEEYQQDEAEKKKPTRTETTVKTEILSLNTQKSTNAIFLNNFFLLETGN